MIETQLRQANEGWLLEVGGLKTRAGFGHGWVALSFNSAFPGVGFILMLAFSMWWQKWPSVAPVFMVPEGRETS